MVVEKLHDGWKKFQDDGFIRGTRYCDFVDRYWLRAESNVRLGNHEGATRVYGQPAILHHRQPTVLGQARRSGGYSRDSVQLSRKYFDNGCNTLQQKRRN